MSVTLTFSGTAGTPYTPVTGWTEYGDGWNYADTTSIVTDQSEYSALMYNAALTGTVIIEMIMRPSFDPDVGTGTILSFIDSDLTGVIMQVRFWQDYIFIREENSGSDGSYISVENISDWLTVVPGVDATLRFELNTATKALLTKINGVTINTGTYTGSITGWKAGVQQYSGTNVVGVTYENIKSVYIDIPSAGTPIRALVNYSGSIKQIADADIGTGKKALTIYNGNLQEYDGTHNAYVVLDPTTKELRQIAASETLTI